ALIGRAVMATMPRYLPDPDDKSGGRKAYSEVLAWFAKGNGIEVGPEMPFDGYVRVLDSVDGLAALVRQHTKAATPAEKASMMELALETLHQRSLLGKDLADGGAGYSDMMGSVLSGLGSFGDDDDDFEDWRRAG
ncbi:MAG: magnesium chelatase, partial [Bacteroidota bacterium]